MAVARLLKKKQCDASINLKQFKIADETMSALRLVSATSNTNVQFADPQSKEEAYVLGVSCNSANIGDQVQVATYGEISDPFFNFGVNEMLFLQANGTISSTPPTTGFLTEIGYGLGPGRIFVNIQKPIKLP